MNKRTIVQLLEGFNSAVPIKQGSGDFVGAVYDTTSEDDAAGVALVVGINYGQRVSSEKVVGQSQDKIGYAKYITLLDRDKHYHTVIWNFFPYLTKAPWLKDIKNSLDESDRIFTNGYNDPLCVFEDLVCKLNPCRIIFHGFCSAVPLLAYVAMQRVKRDVVLVPNLSRGLALDRKREIIYRMQNTTPSNSVHHL